MKSIDPIDPIDPLLPFAPLKAESEQVQHINNPIMSKALKVREHELEEKVQALKRKMEKG
jgi:hypothetical protein